jgi:F-type H+-transporting ATPase subunit epsilon
MDTFHCSIVTPERSVLDCEAKFVAFPAHDGEVGVLPHRAPLVYKLGTGQLRVQAVDGSQLFFVDGGFAQMLDNQLTILTSQARRVTELDAAAAERALTEARAMKIPDEAAFKSRTHAVARAKAQLKLARQKA